MIYIVGLKVGDLGMPDEDGNLIIRGIYDSLEKAKIRQNEINNLNSCYDKCQIYKYILNVDVNDDDI